jgi:hemolysin III
MQHRANKHREKTPHGIPELAPQEEMVNTITHGLGLVLSLLGTIAIIASARSIERGLAIGCGVYAITLVVVYAISTLSHAVWQPRSKRRLRAWDQGVIYLLIAGTYTPFACLDLSSSARVLVLVGMWSVAGIGFLSKVWWEHRVGADFKAHSYVLFGWLPALTMLHLVSLACLSWMAVGGLLYTLGTLFLALDRQFRFFHATWHMFVVAGSACHYYAILTFIVIRHAV